MKNTIYTFFLLIFFVTIKSQETPRPDFKNMSQEQRREYIKNLSPEQRIKLMHEATTMMAIRNLQVPAEKQEAFKKLLFEYGQSQKAIKDKFKNNNVSESNLSDGEAKKLLDQSFDIGQQLLNNRKIYAEKFLKILTPQQVLKLFKQEGKMREKIMEKRDKKRPPLGRGSMIDAQ